MDTLCEFLGNQESLKDLILGYNRLTGAHTLQLLFTIVGSPVCQTLEVLDLHQSADFSKNEACWRLAVLLEQAIYLKDCSIGDQLGTRPIRVEITITDVYDSTIAIIDEAFGDEICRRVAQRRLSDTMLRPSSLPKDTVLKDGKLTYENGTIYKGQVFNDKPHGEGWMKLPNGQVHRGFFLSGKAEGHGERKYPDGASYRGQWRSGKRDGKAIYRVSDEGDIYNGDFVAGQK